MRRLILYIALSLAITLGATWLINLEGIITIDFAGYRAQPSIGIAILALIILIIISIIIFSLIRKIILAPKYLAKFAQQRKKDSGIKALNDGYIALLAGDGERARKLARLASEKLELNSAAKLLEAQSDLLLGDMNNAREHYRALLSNSETSLAALHGLFEQAKVQNREDAALTFASKAYQLSNNAKWAQQALFDGLTKNKKWHEALEIVAKQQAISVGEKKAKNRKQVLLHTAIAKDLEESDPDSALHNIKLALKLLPDFVPAALIGAQIHINRNEIRKASSLLRRVFNKNKHPHLALLYINAQSGASAIERLKRAKELIGESTDNEQLAIILANCAIEAFDWTYARKILQPFLDNPTKNICLAMAKIEEGQNNDEGKAREYLSKAVYARQDYAWVGDNIVLDEWQPISPVSGRFDVFEWKVPPSSSSLGQKEIFEKQMSANILPKNDVAPKDNEQKTNAKIVHATIEKN